MSSDSPRRGAHFAGQTTNPDSGSTSGEAHSPSGRRFRQAGSAPSTPAQSPVTPTRTPASRTVQADVPTITASSATAPRMATTGVSATTARLTESASRHAGAPRPKRRGGGFGAIAVVLVLLLGAGLGAWHFRDRIFGVDEGEAASEVVAGQEVMVNIPEGSGASAVAQALIDAGVISDSSSFLKALQRQNAEQSIKPGTYSFVTGADPSEVVRQLVAGPNTTAGILTVPEGLTLERTAAIVEEQFDIPASVFIDQATAQNYAIDFPFLAEAGDASLEGFLFPKTYDFSGKEVTADLVIRTMLTQYQNEVLSLDFAAAEAAVKERYGVTMSDYDMLTLASIIEREAVTEEDRPLVSSVFYNRLHQGMALQSDATMGYVTGGAVTPEDLQQESPYNTYLNAGLTPTPICSPSIECIRAALEPADTNYLYFFIVENESYSDHSFSETYEEHQAAINRSVQAQG